jgi:hypothetical protein
MNVKWSSHLMVDIVNKTIALKEIIDEALESAHQ